MGPPEPTSWPDPDRGLLERWRRSHREQEQVSREIFIRHCRKVTGAFLGRGHSAERAEELTQETFLRVFKSLETFRGDTLGIGWILGIAASVHVSEVRELNAKKRKAKVVSWDGLPAPGPDPADSAAGPEARLLSRERAEVARTALEGLSDKRRLCLALRDLYELSEEEIAWLLRIEGVTVRANISQARKQLREAMDRRFPRR